MKLHLWFEEFQWNYFTVWCKMCWWISNMQSKFRISTLFWTKKRRKIQHEVHKFLGKEWMKMIRNCIIFEAWNWWFVQSKLAWSTNTFGYRWKYSKIFVQWDEHHQQIKSNDSYLCNPFNSASNKFHISCNFQCEILCAYQICVQTTFQSLSFGTS